MSEKNRLQLKFLACSMAIISGFWLIAGGPGRSAERAVDEALALTDAGSAAIAQFESSSKADLAWYRPEYIQPIQALVDAGRDDVARARSLLAQAEESGRKQKRADAESAQAAAREAQEAITQAQAQLVELGKAVIDARRLQGQTIGVNKKVADKFAEAVRRNADEARKYLSKYRQQNDNVLELAKTNLDNCSISLKQAEGFLPEAGDLSRSGDPRQAERYLAEAQKLTDAASAATFKVVSTLDLCREAESQAAVKFTAVSQGVSQAEIVVNELLKSSGLSADKSFKKSYADISQAQVLLVEASTALKMVVEDGKYDLPLCLTNSNKAIELAAAAQAEAKQQTFLADNARAKRASWESALAHFDGLLEQARSRRQQLDAHAPEAWLSVKDNIDAALQARAAAEKLLAQADEALAGEEFETAISRVGSATASLDSGAKHLTNLAELAAVLEEARRAWPTMRDRASSTIASNSGRVVEYGSYSGAAKADFDAAESDLRQARQEAAARNYQVAVTLAKEADNRADGTGRRCEDAYDDYQEEQRRAAQAALDALNSSSSSSDYDSSSSSGSSWGSSDYGSSSSSSYSGYESSSGSNDSYGYSGSSSGGNDGYGY